MQNKNAYVSQKEVPFPASGVLVSKTDTKGIITYANDAFVAISGYSREELIGKSHNIVRHPDMPDPDTQGPAIQGTDTQEPNSALFGHLGFDPPPRFSAFVIFPEWLGVEERVRMKVCLTT